MVDGEADSKKVLVADQIREQLRREILDGQYEAGEQLRQEELADKFGTSRIPVREALRQLEAEGLIALHPNRGAVVASLSWEDINELMEIRIALECRALRLAVPNMIENDFEVAERLLRSYDEQKDPKKWGLMNWQFHESLYAPCNFPKLLSMVELNYGHVSLFVRTQVSLATGKEQPQKEHYAILEACRNDDVDRAVKLLEDHIVRTKRTLSAAARRTRLYFQNK
ncbi:GntR family transcriptional regulator [Bradyrhizobium sp. BWA-3-5]|uniref:GntR family transcriptional regulator n=1 Tax=Bradyrhizobium sp. BWA-3-5 TaxID=3080013 RepID=UPI00293E0F5C|nr:GntR family transcriptional regulator [Bradyrhizobium sp. BWA-3-5]WOH63723.1 GntR family transcriptional regulator [Bradyrhizobium sp. BWA-3-5]